MPTQKTFKRRVRARMTKTGESYTAARHQLLRKADDPALTESDVTEPAESEETANASVAGGGDAEFTVSDAAMRRASGRSHDEWFVLLDEWGATDRRHPEIARWLRESHAVGGWWAQSITVDYERARGMRERHQMGRGYSISANRTVAVDADRLLEAFTNPRLRRRWLEGASMRQRPTRAARSARFDWPDPRSRVVATVTAKGAGKASVAVQHELLPDAESAERLKGAWREWLGGLKQLLERG
jgi:hypothetical protein